MSSSKKVSQEEDKPEPDGSDISLNDLPVLQSARDWLGEKGIYYIRGEITEASLTDIEHDLLVKQFHPNFAHQREVTILIQSPGGDLAATWAFIDLLDTLRFDIRTVAVGDCFSAAALILMAGTRGKRIVASHANLLVHKFSAATSGHYGALVAEGRHFQTEYRKLVRFFQTRSKYRTAQEVGKHLLGDLDTYLTPIQAIQHGLADHLLVSRAHEHPKKQSKSKRGPISC